MAKFQAEVRCRVRSRIPVFNTYGKQVLLDQSTGRELPKGENNEYLVTTGQVVPKLEEIDTETTHVLQDEEGATVECDTVEELLKAVRKAYSGDDPATEVEVLSVKIQELRTVYEIPGAEVMKES